MCEDGQNPHDGADESSTSQISTLSARRSANLVHRERGGLLRENGDHFRETLLSRGGSRDAMELFQDFRGREPIFEPLLERRGFAPAAED